MKDTSHEDQSCLQNFFDNMKIIYTIKDGLYSLIALIRETVRLFLHPASFYCLVSNQATIPTKARTDSLFANLYIDIVNLFVYNMFATIKLFLIIASVLSPQLELFEFVEQKCSIFRGAACARYAPCCWSSLLHASPGIGLARNVRWVVLPAPSFLTGWNQILVPRKETIFMAKRSSHGHDSSQHSKRSRKAQKKRISKRIKSIFKIGMHVLEFLLALLQLFDHLRGNTQ